MRRLAARRAARQLGSRAPSRAHGSVPPLGSYTRESKNAGSAGKQPDEREPQKSISSNSVQSERNTLDPGKRM